MAGIDRVLRLQNVKIAIELGPKQVLQNLMKKITDSIITVSLGEASDIPKAKGVFNQRILNLLLLESAWQSQ